MVFTANPMQIFNKTFIEMFFEKSYISCMCFGSLIIFICCNGTKIHKIKKEKIILIKTCLLGHHLLYEFETIEIFII